MTKKTYLLLGFILLKFFLQYFLVRSDYDLQRDEYLHLDQAHHLAWGFQSVPPFTSWISYIIYWLGNTVFWVRFFPALFGALTIYIVWKIIEELDGRMFALILGATCVLFSALLRLNILFQPNSFDVLCWTAFYFVILKLIKSGNLKWVFVAAIIFAIGFLNKYNIVFLLIGLVPALIFSSHRNLLIKPQFFVALIIGLLMISPNIFWQYKNNFPVVHHLKELSDTQLVNVDRIGFLKSQLLFFFGSFFVILSALYAFLFYKPFRNYRFFFFSILFTLAAFIYFKAKDYYAIGLYPLYIGFGSVFIEAISQQGWKTYARPVCIMIPILFFIPFYNIGFPNKTPEYITQHPKRYKELGLLRWEDGKDHLLPQDFADMLGWKQLAEKVDSICSKLPQLDYTLILCDNYGQAGAINYYSKNKRVIASSFDADYLNWIEFDRKIVDVVLVKETDDEDKERTQEIPLFDTVYLADRRINKFSREDTISIYVLRGAKIDVVERIRKEAQRKKNTRL